MIGQLILALGFQLSQNLNCCFQVSPTSCIATLFKTCPLLTLKHSALLATWDMLFNSDTDGDNFPSAGINIMSLSLIQEILCSREQQVFYMHYSRNRVSLKRIPAVKIPPTILTFQSQLF